MIDKEYINALNEEIQHNYSIMLGNEENDTPFTTNELWKFNIKMTEELNNKLKHDIK